MSIIRLRLQGKCYYALEGDVNGDCRIDISDFAIMAGGWLIDCIDEPTNLKCIPLEVDNDG